MATATSIVVGLKSNIAFYEIYNLKLQDHHG
ncbi:hypothetical protein SAMN05880561_103466 [Rhizobium sp. RU33A]|nr:hypothetical protein SAMN05880561_103466 [Rhizobium sp. RU33A]